MDLIEKENVDHKNYLEIPTIELLDSFGEGSHIPGSGSAAALSSLIGIELLRTVIKLTIRKPKYAENKEQFKAMLKEIESVTKPKFKDYFNNDVNVFHEVSYLRNLRDKEKDPTIKEKHRRAALDKLREATILPLKMCEDSLNLIDYAFRIFDFGFKSARGDSGVAISNLLSSAQGSLFIVFLNLKSFQTSAWKNETMNKAVDLAQRFTKIQKEAYSRVVNLYNENSNSGQLSLDFYK